MYSEPKQDRSKTTEDAFLSALDKLLVQTSFKNLSIDEIAREAGISKGAFLRRFGSKRQALYVLYERYCEKTTVVMDRIVSELPGKEQVIDSLLDMAFPQISRQIMMSKLRWRNANAEGEIRA